MIRQLIFGTAACLAITLAGSAGAADLPLNCPAIAAQTPESYSGACHPPLTPLRETICEDALGKKNWIDSLITLDSAVGVPYVFALRAAGVGTPQCKDLLEAHKAYDKELQGCGSDGYCILKAMRHFGGELHKIQDRLRPPLDEAALKKFAGGVKFLDGQQQVSLRKRLEQGMDLYPLPQMTLANGNVLVWGFQPHNAQVQSLAVVNRRGAVQVLGVVDGIYLTWPDKAPRSAMQWEKNARVALFVRDPSALAANVPAIRAWTAASILGFNQGCPGKDQARCQAALKLPLPIHAYTLNCNAAKGKVINQHCAMPLPQVPDDVSPGIFWQ